MLSKMLYLKYRPWIIVLLGGLFFFFQTMQMHMLNTSAQVVQAHFHILSQQLSTVSASYFLAIAIMSIPAGLLIDRYSVKKIMIAVICLSALSMSMLANIHSPTLFYVIRTLQGGLHAFCLLSIIKTISQDISAHRMAFATGFVVTLGMLGGMFAQSPYAFLIQHIGWSDTFNFMTGIGLTLGLLMLLILPQHNQVKFHNNYWTNLKEAMLRRNNWQAGLYISLMNLPLLVLGALWGARYLNASQHALFGTQASHICTMLFLGMLIGASIMGFISDWMRSRLRPMLISSILVTMLLLLVLSSHNFSAMTLSIIFLAIGFLSSAQVLGYPYITETNPSYLTASGVAIASMMIMLAPSLAQPLFGYIFEQFSVDLAFAILPTLTLLAMVTCLFMRETFNHSHQKI